MKNFTISLLSVFLFAQISFGQCEIANTGLEDWTLQPIEVVNFSGQTFQNDVLLPNETTSAARAFLMFFGAAFDPAIGQILVDDPIGFMGIEQSTDASEGEFAVKLQGGYDVSFADLYSVSACNEAPDSFFVDIKHVGAEDDTLNIFVIYDEGLNQLPQDTSELANYPAYAYGEYLYNDDTEYQRISLPIIENSSDPIDTFYYLILATTHNDSYFLVDNIGSSESGTMPCEYENYPAFSLQQADPICICDGLDPSDGEVEGSFLLDVVPSADYPPLVYIVNENDDILFKSTDDITNLFDVDFCAGETMYAVQVLYNDDLDVGNEFNLGELSGCFALSEKLEIQTVSEQELMITIFEDGEALNDGDAIVVCPFDDLVFEYSFNNPTDINMTWLLLRDVFVVDQFDHTEVMNFESLPPGEYVIGGIAHPGTIVDYSGQELNLNDQFVCWFPSENFYEIVVLDNGDEGCLSATQDSEILAAVEMMQNPVFDQLVLNFASDFDKTASITIRDINGHTIDHQSYSNMPSQVVFGTADYASGTYFISINTANAQASMKFLKI